MSPRSLGLSITLAIVMIVLVVALIVGWVLLSIFGVSATPDWAALYWTMLPLGIILLAMVLAGVIVYLVLSIKAINLSRRQSNFIDSVTHELKSPIASLKLYVQTLNRMDVDPREQQDFYRFMLEDVERLDNLINHMLQAARVDERPSESELEDVELSEVLCKCAEDVAQRHRTPKEAIQLRTKPCVVRGRRVDLEMIFRNVLDNAVKYAGEQPRVEVTLERTIDGAAVARIIDNGLGIPAKHRSQIFGRFVRLGEELERKAKGTGLGLFIVRTLVRQLKGRITVRNREDQSGAIFEVRLPAQPKPTPSEPASRTLAASSSPKPCTREHEPSLGQKTHSPG